MGGLFGIGGSSAKTDRKFQLSSWGALQSLVDPLTKEGRAETTEGAKNLSSSGNYFAALMSGDPAKMSKVLAPQISGIKSQVGQQVGTINQFSGRSGGTAAAVQQEGVEAQRAIQNLFDLLGPEAAGELAKIGGMQESLGLNETSIGANAAAEVGSQASGSRSGDLAQQNAEQSGILDAGLALFGL